MTSQPTSRTESAASSPATIVIQQGGGSFFLRFFSFLGWAGFAICAFLLLGQYAALSDYFDDTNGIYERHHSGPRFSRDKIAVIDISGVIVTGDGFVKDQIDRIREDESVKGVVVRVDSPGGTVTGSDYIYHHLKKLREEKGIPMVVSMGSIAASGGYYVSMAVGDQENAIFAEPTSTTGSIGVIIPHYDVSGLMQRYDVVDDSIASHPRKQMLSMTKPIPDEHREILQGYVDESFGRFKQIVLSGRPEFREQPETLDALATGEIFTATKAQEQGLVDEIGFIEDAIDRVTELAGLDAETTRVVRFERPVGLFDISGIAMSRSADRSQLAALLDLSSPRAYFLSTSLPPFVASYARLTGAE